MIAAAMRVAAVSNGGGVGLLGGGNGDRAWLTRELPIVAQGTTRPWGVGFQSWAVDAGTLDRPERHWPKRAGADPPGLARANVAGVLPGAGSG